MSARILLTEHVFVYLQLRGTVQETECFSSRGSAMNRLQSWSMAFRSMILRPSPMQQLACMVQTLLMFRLGSQRPPKSSVLRNLILMPSSA